MSKKKIKLELQDLHDDFGWRANDILNIIARFRYNEDCLDCLYEKVKEQLKDFESDVNYKIQQYDPSYISNKVDE